MCDDKKLFVIKRDSREQEIHFDKITFRIKKLCYGLNMSFIDPVAVTIKVINCLYPGVTTWSWTTWQLKSVPPSLPNILTTPLPLPELLSPTSTKRPRSSFLT